MKSSYFFTVILLITDHAVMPDHPENVMNGFQMN